MSTAPETYPAPSPLSAAWLSHTRIELIGLMLLGLAAAAAIVLGSLAVLPDSVAGSPDPILRLAHTMALACVPSLVVMLHVSACFRLFDTEHTIDPLSGIESRRYQISGRSLQNTVEQAIIFIPALLALGLLSEGEQWRLVPALALTWAVGRLAFSLGYQIKIQWRAPGMVMTLTASAICLGAVAMKVL